MYSVNSGMKVLNNKKQVFQAKKESEKTLKITKKVKS
jgi:hypothetical protein